MPNWVFQLKCYDGTDPDVYQRKIEEKGLQREGIQLRQYSNDTAIDILRKVVQHSLTLPITEHRENMEDLAAVNWLWVEKEGHKKSREFHDTLSRSFGYYFKKKEIKILLEYFMRPRLGFDIMLFFRLFAEIIKSEEEKHNVLSVNAVEFTPIWTQVLQRIEYVTLCNAYLKRCEDKVRSNTLNYLKKVLLDRANSRFKKPIETILGELDHLLFKK